MFKAGDKQSKYIQVCRPTDVQNATHFFLSPIEIRLIDTEIG